MALFKSRGVDTKVDGCEMSMGLDMSKVFDTISRSKLLDVMAGIVSTDENFLIQHLLYSSKISVRD